MDFDDLKDPQLQAKLRETKTPEELLAIAKECGMTLEDAQLEHVLGGSWCDSFCPYYYDCRTDGSR